MSHNRIKGPPNFLPSPPQHFRRSECRLQEVCDWLVLSMKLQLCLISLFVWYPGLLAPFQVICQDLGSSTLPHPIRTNFLLIFAWTNSLSSAKSIKHSSSFQNLLKLSTKSKAWNGGLKYYHLSLISLICVAKRRWERSFCNFSLPLVYHHCFMLLPEKFSNCDAHVIASNASNFLATLLNQLNILTASSQFFCPLIFLSFFI